MVVVEVSHRIERTKREAVTVAVIEQSVRRAEALAETCVMLSQGQVACSGQACDAKQEAPERCLGGPI